MEYNELTPYEKSIVDVTALNVDDINHYEKMLNRKMTKRELKLSAILRNSGVVLNDTDFKIKNNDY